MKIKDYIKLQKSVKDTKTAKYKFLKSISELLLLPKAENFKRSVKYLAVLSNSYHVELKSLKVEKYKHIEKVLLYKTSEVIQNKNGYSIILPEMFKIIVTYAKFKSVELIF